MPTHELGDLGLAQRVAAGDEQALEMLYERYADSLFAFVVHQLAGPRQNAEDIWQDSLVAAFQSIGSYRGQARFFTWLCGIARHKIIDHLRRQRRSPVEQFSDLPEPRLSALIAAGPLPEEIVANRANRVRVVEALACLPQSYRTALTARYADGLNVGEVAAQIGRNYKATESLLSRARAAFRSVMRKLEEESR
ncbi:MAG: RNA polymerase sigma factor [Anaerolineae bacterium]|nr:RNA polymerase sigma factor [Anaerolineae bacterium]